MRTLDIRVNAEKFGADFKDSLQKALSSAFGEGAYFKFQDVKDLAEGMQSMDVQVAAEEFGEGFQETLSKALTTAFGEKIGVKFQDEEEDEDEDDEKKEEMKEKISTLEEKVTSLEESLASRHQEDKDKEDEEEEDEDKDKEEMKEKVFALRAKIKKFEDEIESIEDKEEKEKKKRIVEGLREELDKLQEGVDKDALIEDLRSQIKALKARLQEKEGVVAEATEKTRKLADEKWKQEVKTFIADGEREGKILPRQKKLVETLMESAKEHKVVKFTDAEGKKKDFTTIELVKQLVNDLPSLVNFAEISETGEFKAYKEKVVIGDNEHPVDDADLADEAQKYSQKHNVPYDEALIEIERQKKGKKE